jgi:diguanylate cyclase (GGDEF)-like protein
MEPISSVIKVLLIDDDEDDYLILRECLLETASRSKFTMDWAQTYQSGLTHMLQSKHDVYLIDHYLGEKSGLELLKEAVESGCQAPMIIITGQSSPEIDQAAMYAGATDYLVKENLDGQLLERAIRYSLERQRLLNKIREMAVRDALTDLYNRRELHRFLDYELIKSWRYNHPISLLMIDIDHFKEINDRFGHRTGDEILKQVAQILKNNTRACDLTARFGGDEFIIVMPETPAIQGLNGAERLRQAVEEAEIRVKNELGIYETIDITISTGVSEYPADASSGDALIDLADHALYQAKHLGCNRVVLLQAGREEGLDQP